MNSIKVNDLKELVGKTIEWKAPAYSANEPCGGVAEITSVDESKRSPITAHTITGDNLEYAFMCDYSEELCYGDEGRFITYRIVN